MDLDPSTNKNKSSILRIVLENVYFEKLHLVQMALVCKSWSEVALDFIWEQLNSSEFIGLFCAVIAPLKRVGEDQDTWRFKRELQLDDWARFKKYSHRVVSLKLQEERAYYTPVFDKPSLFGSLAVMQPTGGVFPNLKALTLNSNFGFYANIFMSSKVETLRITLAGQVDGRSHDDLFRNLALRMHNLKILEIDIGSERFTIAEPNIGPFRPICQHEDALCQFLRQQHFLERLVLPEYWLTTRVAQSISHLEHLQAVSFPAGDIDEWHRAGHPMESLDFDPLVEANMQETEAGQVTDDTTSEIVLEVQISPFLALCSLSISIPYSSFQRFLIRWRANQTNSSGLKTLDIRSQVQESPETMEGLLESLSLRCCALSSLRLSSMCSSLGPAFTNPADPVKAALMSKKIKNLVNYRVGLSTISPLFNLKSLKVLELHHHLPPAFSPSDLEVIATNLSYLEVLDLFSDPHPLYLFDVRGRSGLNVRLYAECIPMYQDYSGLEIPKLQQTLRTFATNCPHLRTLGVFVCAHIPEQALFAIEESYPDFETIPQLDNLTISEPGHSSKGENRRMVNPDHKFFPSLERLRFGTSPCLGDLHSIALVVLDYIQPNTKIQSGPTWGFGSRKDKDEVEYLTRLERGGKLPNPIPIYPTSSPNSGCDELATQQRGALKRRWKRLPDGSPLPGDVAVVVNMAGEPLSLNTDSNEEGLEHKTRWIPGVSFLGIADDDTAHELDKREARWDAVQMLLPLAARIISQERVHAMRSWSLED